MTNSGLGDDASFRTPCGRKPSRRAFSAAGSPTLSRCAARSHTFGRQFEREGRALSQLAFDLHLRIVMQHDVLHDCKPQSRAARIAGARFIHAVKTFRQPRNVFLRNADAVVANLYPEFVSLEPLKSF